MTRYVLVVFWAAFVACEGARTSPLDQFDHSQTTIPEFHIGTAMGDDPNASFASVSQVLILANGDRIVVAEAGVARATVWTPDGSLVQEIGGYGDGPGEFKGGFTIHRFRGGFLASAVGRFTLFSNSGALIETIRFPPTSLSFRGFGLAPLALLGDGTMLAIPRVPADIMMGTFGDDPMTSLPVLRLSEGDEQWSMDTVVALDYRNRHLTIVPKSGSGGIQTTQPFGDYDLTYLDPASGSVVVVQRSIGDGKVALTEVNADGDTVWHHHMSLPPVRPRAEWIADIVDALVQRVVTPEEREDLALYQKRRDQVMDELYVPDPLPGALIIRGTASREIWIRSFEVMDTFVVWYAVHRGGDPTRVRTMLLPHGFAVHDATDTHVWGIGKDELGVNYVMGRRLVSRGDGVDSPAAAASPGGTREFGPQSWTTRTDYHIEEPNGGKEGFDRFAHVRVSPNGERIVATDGRRSGRVRVLLRDGTLVRTVGPAELASGAPIGVWTGVSGFWVREYGTGRVARYQYGVGAAIDTLALPTGLEHFTPTPRGGLIGKADLPPFDWERLYQPLKEQAVLNVTETGEEESLDTIVVLDVRHMEWMLGIRGEGSRYPAQVFISQPFADYDLTWFDAETGSVGVVRRNGSPGVVEVFEVVATGDTAWYRRFGLPAVPLSAGDAEQAIKSVLSTLQRDAERTGQVFTEDELRNIVESIVHVPSHLPAVTRVVASSAGDVWLQTPEMESGLSVWYSIRRGDNESTPRRVLVPSMFRLEDGSETHIWGISTNSSGLRVILGLGLVAPLN